jgi:hypothetical protein
MKKQILSFATLLLLAILAVAPKAAEAQWVGYFSNGAFCLGPEIALPLGFAGGGVLIGANGEVAVTRGGTLGSGRLAIAFGLDYWGASSGGVNVAIIPIHGLVNYHFAIADTKEWDPYVGIGLGYAIVSVSGTAGNGTAASGVFVDIDAGARYWFSPTVAARAQFSLGYLAEYLALGVDFELN